MPIYQFRDQNSGEEWEEMLSISARESFLKENPHIIQVITAPAIVSGVGGIRTDGGLNEVFSKISEAHPTSPLAEKHGSKSIKDVKTREAVQRQRKRQEKKT